MIGRKDSGESWTAALNAVEAFNPLWYALITEMNGEDYFDEIIEVAGWIESATNDKIYSYQSNDVYANEVDLSFITVSSDSFGRTGAYQLFTGSRYLDASDGSFAANTSLNLVAFAKGNDVIYYEQDGATWNLVLATWAETPSQSVVTPTVSNRVVLATGPAYEGFSIEDSGTYYPDPNDAQLEELAEYIGRDLFGSIKALNYDRSIGSFNGSAVGAYDNAGNVDAAIIGELLPYPPGTRTAKFKKLKGVIAARLSAAEVSLLETNGANYFTTIGGLDMYAQGVVASGEYIDVIQGIDWIKYTMQFRVFNRLQQAAKVPYTDKGASIVESEMQAVLNEAVARTILAEDPAPTTFIPKVGDVAQEDRAARLLPDCKFDGTLAGAIHKVKINGSITV